MSAQSLGLRLVCAKLFLLPQVTLPDEKHRPDSGDPEVTEQWQRTWVQESYDRVVASWRAQSPRFAQVRPSRIAVEDDKPEGGD
jgi:hypothetical protein